MGGAALIFTTTSSTASEIDINVGIPFGQSLQPAYVQQHGGVQQHAYVQQHRGVQQRPAYVQQHGYVQQRPVYVQQHGYVQQGH